MDAVPIVVPIAVKMVTRVWIINFIISCFFIIKPPLTPHLRENVNAGVSAQKIIFNKSFYKSSLRSSKFQQITLFLPVRGLVIFILWNILSPFYYESQQSWSGASLMPLLINYFCGRLLFGGGLLFLM